MKLDWKGIGEEQMNRIRNAHLWLIKLPKSNDNCILQRPADEVNKFFFRSVLKVPNSYQSIGNLIQCGKSYRTLAEDSIS